MKKLSGKMYVEQHVADEMERICREPDGSVKSDGTEFDKEYVFEDGMRMAVQVCPSNTPAEESCWTQGVLFTHEGAEVGCTDVGESFLGEYCVEYNGVDYEVTVFSVDPIKKGQRLFIVGPAHDEDTLWQLCSTCERNSFLEVYGSDKYREVYSSDSEADVRAYATAMGVNGKKVKAI